eukprot:761193-Hanusia_phi.AAC.5
MLSSPRGIRLPSEGWTIGKGGWGGIFFTQSKNIEASTGIYHRKYHYPFRIPHIGSASHAVATWATTTSMRSHS